MPGRVAVVLPADQAGDAVARSSRRCPRRSSARASTMTQSPPPLTGSMLRAPMSRPSSGPCSGNGPCSFSRCFGVVVVAAVRAAAEHDPVGPAVVARRDSGVTQQIALPERNSRFTPASRIVVDALELADVPVLVVADADERLALQAVIGRDHVAVGAVGHVVAVLLEPVGQRELERQELARAERERVVDDARRTAPRGRRGGRS